jgi:hypothetical protein
MCGGNDCVFESNLIEHTCYEVDDSGAFDTCGQSGTAFIQRGNVLRNNTFKRVRKEDATYLGFPSVVVRLRTTFVLLLLLLLLLLLCF